MADQKAQFDDYVVLKKYLALQEPPTPKVLDEKKTQKPSGETPLSQGFSTMATMSSSQSTRGVARGVPNLPPKVSTTVKASFQRLFSNTNTTVTAYNITGNSLAGSLGAVCYVANTTARAVFGLARIKSITVWPGSEPVTSGSLRNLVDLRWSNGPLSTIVDDRNQVQIVPSGITSTKGMRFVPPPHTLCGSWFQLGAVAASTLFTIEMSAGCVIIVDVEAALSNNFTGATISLSGVTAAVGTFGYTPLDGSGGVIQPIGVGAAF